MSTTVDPQAIAATSVARVETRNSVYLVTTQYVGDRTHVMVAGGILDKPMIATSVSFKLGESMTVRDGSPGVLRTSPVERITFSHAS